ncbi:MAG: phenylalanyl-tRNA synthetase subunit beta [Pseudomonadota bacterium]
MKAWITVLLLIFFGAHIALWTSDMPRDVALKLTGLNAAAWAVILVPAWAVGKWAAAHKKGSRRI